MANVPASNRYRLVTIADNGNTIVLGRATTPQSVGVFEIQFNPDTNFNGSFIVVAHVGPPGPNIPTMPFMPISYRRINIGNVAQDWAIVSAPITGAAIIQVPANGLSIGLLTNVLAGTCDIVSYDLQGASSM